MIKAEKKGNPHPKIDISKGRIQKEIVEFSTKRLTPPLLVEKKNDLRVMKWILYDMGLLTLVRPGSELKRPPPTQKLKKKKVYLKMIIRQNPMF